MKLKMKNQYINRQKLTQIFFIVELDARGGEA